MALKDLKITDAQMNENGVVSAPNKLSGTARENKAVFDKLVRNIVSAAVNRLIDALTAATGAGEIGARPPSGLVGDTVQALLENLKAYVDREKVQKVAGMDLSHNDYNDAEKAEVAKVRDKADKTETARIQSEVDRKAERAEVLTKTNTTPYTPAQEYHPATKEYVDRTVNEGGNVTMEQVERWDSRTVILCDCTYDPREKTFHLTRKDTGQTITDGAALQFIPPVDYTRWDKMTVDGEPVDLGYTQSRIELQDGAWLAGRQIQVYLSAGGGAIR